VNSYQETKRKKAIKASYFSILGNALMAIVKGLAGFLGNSHALIADAVESTADVFSSALVLFGMKYSSRPPDKNYPYGHGRIEPLITFMIVAFMVISAAWIIYSSIENMKSPDEELPRSFTLYVLGGIILFKELSYRFVMKKGRETDSLTLKADAIHHRTDAITSLVAFVGISIALLTGHKEADEWAALLTAVVILYNAYRIFRPALGEMMDEHRYDDLKKEIRAISKTVPGIIYTEKCLIRKTGMQYHVDLHAVVDPEITVREGHDLAHDLQDTLYEKLPQIQYVLIHIEPDDYHHEEGKCSL